MPRKRMIDPDIWDSLDFNSLPMPGRILFIGMFSLADDEGRLRANPSFLKKSIFGYDMDISHINVAEWELAIINSGLVKAYRNGHENYILVTNFVKYQKINHPTKSKLPEPPKNSEDYITCIEQLCDDYLNPTVALPDNYSRPTVALPEDCSNHKNIDIIKAKIDSKIDDSRTTTVGLHEGYSRSPSQYSIVKVSLGKVNTLSNDNGGKPPEKMNYKNYVDLLKKCTDDSKRIGLLINAFKELHSDAPEIDLENLGGRIGSMFTRVFKRDAGYFLKILWDSSSQSISGSHLDYIQQICKGKNKQTFNKSENDPEKAERMKKYEALVIKDGKTNNNTSEN